MTIVIKNANLQCMSKVQEKQTKGVIGVIINQNESEGER